MEKEEYIKKLSDLRKTPNIGNEAYNYLGKAISDAQLIDEQQQINTEPCEYCSQHVAPQLNLSLSALAQGLEQKDWLPIISIT